MTETYKGPTRHLFFIASKTAHAPKWRKLKEEGVPLGCTWPEVTNWEQAPDALRGRFWVENLQELKKCTCLILYCEPQDQQQGGLIETGVAISEGIPVIVVYEGYTPLPEPSWTKHPLVTVVRSLDAAFEAAKGV